jgi:hypothetical protein
MTQRPRGDSRFAGTRSVDLLISTVDLGSDGPKEQRLVNTGGSGDGDGTTMAAARGSTPATLWWSPGYGDDTTV